MKLDIKIANKFKKIRQSVRNKCFGSDAAKLLHRLSRMQKKNADVIPPEIIEEIFKSSEFVKWRRENSPTLIYPEELPVSLRKDEIKEALLENQVLIIAGETGSGKTTQLPKICLEAGRGVKGIIGCTQPRRIAAVSVAERVADELSGNIGEAVGYQVRFDERLQRETFIKFMTDGILLSESRFDPDLLAYDTLIIDEAHERSLNIDFILGYLKRLIKRRSDLKIIISSATLDVERFSKYFDDAPVILVEGRTYPVDIINNPPDDEDVDTAVWIGHTVEKIFREFGRGDVLIFMTGEQDIRETVAHLERRPLAGVEVLPLYARLTPAEQRRVFHPQDKARIIVSTNVAETSVTVPRIRYVIDTGQARVKRYNARTGVESLQIEGISRASAAQRSGRCGRVGPGICVRLYSDEDFQSRIEFTDPEIKRSSLAGVILQMELLRLGKVEDFPFIEPPAYNLVKAGYDELEEIGALDESRRLTRDGKRIAALPIEPRFGRMLLSAYESGWLEEALTIVAALSVQDPRLRPVDKKEAADTAHKKYADKFSDFMSWIHLWRKIEEVKADNKSNNKFSKFCKENFLSYLRIREWTNTRRQLAEEMSRKRFKQEKHRPVEKIHAKKHDKKALPNEGLHKALLSGLLSRSGKYHEEEKIYRGGKDIRFHIWPGSGVVGGRPAWVMAAEMVETSRSFARCVAVIKPEWFEEVAPHLLKKSYTDPFFDEKSGFVRAYMNASIFGLQVIERRRIHYGPIDSEKSRKIFIAEALVKQKLKSKLYFYRKNNELINSLHDEQDKLRCNDLLIDEDGIFSYYDKHLPADVYTLKALERFCEREKRAGRNTLVMNKEDVALQTASGLSREDFPERCQVCGFNLALTYRFDPAKKDDGVSCSVPIGCLANINSERFLWLVPGLFSELVLELLRSLPRSLRRELNPIPEAVKLCLKELEGKFAEGVLCMVLADVLHRKMGIRIKAEDFRPEQVPAFLKMNIKVIDTAGKLLSQGRDLEELQSEFANKGKEEFSKAPKEKFEREKISQWDFDFPSKISLPGGAVGYPAIFDSQDSVSLKVLDSKERAERVSVKGICRLALLVLEGQAKKIARSMPLTQNATLYYSAIGGTKESLQNDILLSAVLYLYEENIKSLPRKKSEFSSLVELVRSGLYEPAYKTAQAASESLEKANVLRGALVPQKSPAKQESFDEIEQQLKLLVFSGFAKDAGVRNVERIPYYIEGLQVRIKKLNADPQKDRKWAALINPLWSKCFTGFKTVQKQGVPIPALLEYRWLLEEYALQIFAQELKPKKVSPKLLEEVWSKTGL